MALTLRLLYCEYEDGRPPFAWIDDRLQSAGQAHLLMSFFGR